MHDLKTQTQQQVPPEGGETRGISLAELRSKVLRARETFLSEDEMMVMLCDPDPRVRAALATHPFLPVEHLEELAMDPTPLVRRHVASNPNTPMRLVDEVLADLADRHLRWLLTRKDLSPLVLYRLAHTSEVPWQAMAARNPSTPWGCLEVLACKQNLLVLCALCANPLCKNRLLDLLLLSVPWQEDVSALADLLVLNPHLTERHLQQLAAFPDPNLRGVTARHPETPEWLLVHLSKDDSLHVLLQLAKNQSTPVEVLESFVRDPRMEECVLCWVTLHPNATGKVLEEALRRVTPDVLRFHLKGVVAS